MFLNYFLLCASASIDAIGIGISYGIRKTIINNYSKIIILTILFVSTFLGVAFGNILSLFIEENLLKLLGSIVLILIGLYIVYENIHKKINIKSKIKEEEAEISLKEAMYLALSVSIDAFSMGIYASVENVNIVLFPLCMTIVHLSFLFLGKFLGKNIVNVSKISDNVWKVISGVLLIFIGIIKYFF